MAVNVLERFPNRQRTSTLYSARNHRHHSSQPPPSEDKMLPYALPSHLNVPGGPSAHTENQQGGLDGRSWNGLCPGERARHRDVTCWEKEQRKQRRDEKKVAMLKHEGSLFLPLFASLRLGVTTL